MTNQSSGFNHLSGGKVNLVKLQEFLKTKLLELIYNCKGPKTIVWDETLAGPVGLVAKYKVLRELEVTSMFPLKPGDSIKTDAKNIIFITRPYLHLMDMVADVIHGQERSGQRKECHLFFVPRKSKVCQKRLESKGVFGNFTFIEDLPCMIFPFDNDLMSMELEHAFKEYNVEKDPSFIHDAAEAVTQLESLYGGIARMSGRGPAAQRLHELLLKTEPPQIHPPSTPLIDHLLLIDRSVDLLSPLATQLTYEGLIDEIFEIKNTTAKFPSEKFSDEDESHNEIQTNKKQVILNSGDEVFTEIRDKNFCAVGPILTRKVKIVSSQLEERPKKGDDQTSIQEMKKFVSRFNGILSTKKSLGLHTTIAELIKDVTDSTEFLDSLQLEQELMFGFDTDKVQPHIEDCISHQQPLVKVLRLICLQSATNTGLKPKVLEHYKREILQTYGFHHILSLSNLEKAGLLKVQTGQRSYTVLRKTLRLTVEDGNEATPKDAHFVHSVYAPLSVRLATTLARGTRSDLTLLPGPAVDAQLHPSHESFRRKGSAGSIYSQGDGPRVVLVFFLGGCTFAEISALRFFNQQEDSPVEFVIATTKLINGNTFIKSLMEPLDPTGR